jgi:hypothetical protein
MRGAAVIGWLVASILRLRERVSVMILLYSLEKLLQPLRRTRRVLRQERIHRLAARNSCGDRVHRAARADGCRHWLKVFGLWVLCLRMDCFRCQTLTGDWVDWVEMKRQIPSSERYKCDSPELLRQMMVRFEAIPDDLVQFIA